MQNFLKVIDSNFKAEESTCMYFLHERGVFDRDSFMELYKAILEATKATLNQSKLDRKLCRKIHFIHIKFLDCLERYLLQDFRKERLSSIFLEHYKYSERMEFAVDCFFIGCEMDENSFEPFDLEEKL